MKNTTESGMSVTSGGQSNIDTGRVGGNLELKTKRCPGTGTQLTTKWSTENLISTSLSLQDKLLQGLTLTLDSTYSPDSGSKNGRLKAEFASSAVLMALDTDLNLSGPILNTSAVLGHKVSGGGGCVLYHPLLCLPQGWLAGLQMAYDSSKSKLVKNNFSLGYSQGDFCLHSNINDGAIFGASMYQKVNSNIETGVNLGWTASSNTTSFGIALKYTLDQTGSVRKAFKVKLIDNPAMIILFWCQIFVRILS